MNDIKHYTLEELVNNSDFIKWVYNDMPKNSIWTNLKTKQSDFESVKRKAIELVQAIRFEEDTNTQIAKENIWSRIDSSITQDQESGNSAKVVDMSSTKKARKISRLYWLGAAAAACILFLFVFNTGSSSNSFQEVYAQDLLVNHILPDNSNIELTPGSHISYEEAEWSDKRNIKLEGEAFFNVQKGESFTVETKNATVIVLGTSFNIKESDDGTEVICKTGKVKVISKASQKEEIITANQLVNVVGTEVNKTSHTQVYIPWKEEDFSFTKMTLGDVFKQIESSFNVNIDLAPEHVNTEFEGSFEKAKLEDALYNICWPMKLKYSINGSQVSIQSAE